MNSSLLPIFILLLTISQIASRPQKFAKCEHMMFKKLEKICEFADCAEETNRSVRREMAINCCSTMCTFQQLTAKCCKPDYVVDNIFFDLE